MMIKSKAMNVKEIIFSLIEAFDKNDTELILSHFTEDIEWEIINEAKFSGKAEIRTFFEANPDMEMFASTKDHVIIDGNQAMVNGEVQCGNKSKEIYYDMYYCDIYDLEGDKIKKMTSFTINKKKD